MSIVGASNKKNENNRISVGRPDILPVKSGIRINTKAGLSGRTGYLKYPPPLPLRVWLCTGGMSEELDMAVDLIYKIRQEARQQLQQQQQVSSNRF